MFNDINDVIKKLAEQDYIADQRIGTLVYLAAKLEKPILVEGPAGVGKTDLARRVAACLGRELIRLQCYEGLDESKALYEWEYSKQLLYTQILKDKITEVVADAKTLEEATDRIYNQDDVFFSERFLLPRPLLKAIESDEPTVLLIDEIDKADSEFEAFLLEVLSDFTVSVPEIGTLEAKHKPFVVLTSNNTREMSDAIKRRCLHLYIDFPDGQRELEIVRMKVPGVQDALLKDLVDFVQEIRKKDLKKIPSISETLDWARALTLLNAQSLGDEIVQGTLNTILKYEGDVIKAERELRHFLDRKRAEAANPAEVKDEKKEFLN